MDNCIFCQIIKGDIPSYKVWEDDRYFAFLTIKPHAEGHTLLVPKKHDDYLFDLNDPDYSELLLTAKQLSLKLQQAFNPASGKVGLVVVGLEVHHVHLHLIPLNSEKDLDSSSASDATPEQLKSTLSKISA